jgi:hypothetical protein
MDRRVRFATSTLGWLIGLSAALMTPAQVAQDGAVWFWFATCGGPAMTLEVRLDKAVLHKTSFPLCRAARASADSQGQASRIEFSFRSSRPIVWTGYRERADRTPTGQVLEGNIWQAGADSDALTIGITFVTRNRILTNTIHIAHPDRRDESTIAKGLSLVTYPAAR